MNFQDLIKIEKADFYIDVAFRRAKERASAMKIPPRLTRLEKIRRISLEKIKIIQSSLLKPLEKITFSFPDIDSLPEFYIELIKSSTDYLKLKKALGSVNWASNKVKEYSTTYSRKIRDSRDFNTMTKHLNAYYGRVASFLKQITKQLKYLEEARRIMKSFPAVKTSISTAALFGFPNVGKTTLLKKLSGSMPEINSYAFTTKNINIGYMKDKGRKLQLLDTPGSLERHKTMNEIEKQAYLAVKYCADIIVCVIDLTEPYPLENQLKLVSSLEKKYEKRKKIIIFLSKTDIIEKKLIDDFKTKFETITDIKILKEKLFSLDN